MTADSCRAANSPKVSVIMPAYNAERFVADAVESILGQTLRDIELLVYDDASSDRTTEICEKISKRDSRMRVYRNEENRGVVFASNYLIAEAKAPYVARMDADDIALPERLEWQTSFLDQRPEILVVGGQQELMDEAGFLIGIVKSPLTHSEIDRQHIQGFCCINGPTAMMRREAVLRAGGYPENSDSAEDFALWLRLGELGEVANIPDVVLRYRLTSTGLSEVSSEKQKAAVLRACHEAFARRNVSGHVLYKQWRPGRDRRSQLEYALRYGWMAWNNGHRDTCRRFGIKSVRLSPFDQRAWRLLVLGALKQPSRAN